MEEGRSARLTPLEPSPAALLSAPAPPAGTLLPLPGRHLLGDFPRHLREGANETLGVGIDPRRRPGDARSKTPGLPGARESGTAVPDKRTKAVPRDEPRDHPPSAFYNFHGTF